MNGPAERMLISAITFYKRHISPFIGAHCRFVPTCSEYALEAVRTHGALKGLMLTIWRLLRCNPLFKGGYDPVPPRRGHSGNKAER